MVVFLANGLYNSPLCRPFTFFLTHKIFLSERFDGLSFISPITTIFILGDWLATLSTILRTSRAHSMRRGSVASTPPIREGQCTTTKINFSPQNSPHAARISLVRNFCCWAIFIGKVFTPATRNNSGRYNNATSIPRLSGLSEWQIWYSAPHKFGCEVSDSNTLRF